MRNNYIYESMYVLCYSNTARFMTEINSSMSICTLLVKTGQIFDTTSALFTAGLIPYIANRLI